jgi:hypothetical protein
VPEWQHGVPSPSGTPYVGGGATVFSHWTIEDCHFESRANKSALHAISISGVMFKGNTISGGSERPFVFVGSQNCDFGANSCQGGECPSVAEDCRATAQHGLTPLAQLKADDATPRNNLTEQNGDATPTTERRQRNDPPALGFRSWNAYGSSIGSSKLGTQGAGPGPDANVLLRGARQLLVARNTTLKDKTTAMLSLLEIWAPEGAPRFRFGVDDGWQACGELNSSLVLQANWETD